MTARGDEPAAAGSASPPPSSPPPSSPATGGESAFAPLRERVFEVLPGNRTLTEATI